MTITKGEKTFSVKENKKSWTVSRNVSGVALSVNVPKELCRDFESLAQYVRENDLF